MSAVPAPKILVIEDETTQRILVKEYLEESGFVVRLADDGQRGLEMASVLKPDLILLDLLLPSLDGYTLCTRLKQDPVTKDIPVILVTAARESDVIERGMAAGASDFVTKPVDWSYLADRVAHVLQQSRDMRRLTEEKQASEEKLAALLESKDISQDQIDEIRAMFSAPAKSEAHISLEEHERQLNAVRAEAEVRVRQAANQARANGDLEEERRQRALDAERAEQRLNEAARSFWSVIGQTCKAQLPTLVALDNITSGTFAEADNASSDEFAVNAAPQNAIQELHAKTRNMMRLSQFMSGEADVDHMPVDLVGLVAEAVNRVRPMAEQQQIAVDVVLPDGALNINADQTSLRYALLSLITNALKYCPHNASVHVELASGPDHDVLLSVSDNGVGMAPALVENLQQCTVMPASAMAQSDSRFGFGIPTAMAVMQSHGGSLKISSEVGQGTTMTMQLPSIRLCSQPQEHVRVSLSDKSAARREETPHEDVPIARLNALLAS